MNGVETAQLVASLAVFAFTAFGAAWAFMEDRRRMALALALVSVAAVMASVSVGISSGTRVTRECEERGGYIDSARGITLCIDVEDGTIIRLGGDR